MHKYAAEEVKKALANLSGQMAAESIVGTEASVRSYLDEIKKTGAISTFKIDGVKELEHTWATLYPSRVERWAVLFYFKVFKGRATHYKQRWFHTLLPFEIEYGQSMDLITDSAPNFEDITEEAYYALFDRIGAADAKRSNYWAHLAKPYTEHVIDYMVMPDEPIDVIHMSMVLTKTGATFGDLVNSGTDKGADDEDNQTRQQEAKAP